MRQRCILGTVLAVVGVFAAAASSATTVRQMKLDELTRNAGNIVRGTVLSIEPGTVKTDGGEIPVTTYLVRVSDNLKGRRAVVKGRISDHFAVTMFGSEVQTRAPSGLRRFSAITLPKLRVGQEYVLFTTPPGPLGLSVTVGLGQGTFRFVGNDRVVNGANNAGLIRGSRASRLAPHGPIPYAELADRVRAIVSRSVRAAR